MRRLKNILVTGGCGFIGSRFIRALFGDKSFDGRVVNLDALTYAGNPESLDDTVSRFGGTRYFFKRGNISDGARVQEVFKEYDIDTVAHFAAESHVDRSIDSPDIFIKTNIGGTFTLLEAARKAWTKEGGGIRDDSLFHHISTDEVYGSLAPDEPPFTETTPYAPRSPYAASKAASDHLALSYFHTYGLPVTLSNCSNNYGAYQFPEKLIPLMILNMLEGKSLPIYGDGQNEIRRAIKS
jgi:dTDP-glucose 4,6-dehydratase